MRLLKYILLTCTAVFGLFLDSTANPIDLATAQALAAKFMGTDDVWLSVTYRTDYEATSCYLFNTPDGFVIVAADDGMEPIIAYSHEGPFDPNQVPLPMEDYLQEYASRMQYAITHPIQDSGCQSNDAMPPLLTDRWHQGCLYNSLCPAGPGPCGHAEVGCVAVAMGQIMHYWGYPATGWGTHHYTNEGAVLSADFGNTAYDWDHMPDSLTGQSSQAEVEAVATLLYHCGVAVDMKYGASGSTAHSEELTDALVRYFDYARQLHKEKRSDYSDEEWTSLLKGCLAQRRPILYSGFGSAGHAFVCDGYDENNLFHFNWGWGGNANGYFSLGHLNPNGHDFNSSNFAILDIVPEYEPCIVSVSVFPPNTGNIEGTGECHYGTSCTLTATPTEDYDFLCWKRDGEILSELPSITFLVEDDINIEAHFSCFPVGQITACHAPDTSHPDHSDVSLSWSREDSEWVLLKQFGVNGETGGVATDGEYIYLNYAPWNDLPFAFEKYTMDGELVEAFNLEGIPDAFCLAYDGTDYYCNQLYSSDGLTILIRLDLDNKTVLDHTLMESWYASLAYDPGQDGFWLCEDHRARLHDRQGHRIVSSPTVQDYIYGSGYVTARDGTPHLLLLRDSGVFNYDIENNVIMERPVLAFESGSVLSYGACTGKYEDKDALFFAMNDSLRIYEIKGSLVQNTQIVCYRIYRSDSEGNVEMLADGIHGSTYLDTTWAAIQAGVYRYGISSVTSDGNELETLWSDTLLKTDYGLNESIADKALVYPNPVHDRLIVEHNRPIRRCEVFTMDGKPVYDTSHRSNRIEIQTQHWPSGTYLIRITTDDFVEMKQFIQLRE